jgi:hypothetical protein
MSLFLYYPAGPAGSNLIIPFGDGGPRRFFFAF